MENFGRARGDLTRARYFKYILVLYAFVDAHEKFLFWGVGGGEGEQEFAVSFTRLLLAVFPFWV